MESRYEITAALPHHLDALPAIELSAAALLEGHAPEAVLRETTPASVFMNAREDGRLWVALLNQIPVGFAHVEMLAADLPHLQEMDVLPHHGRRGVGTALLRTVFDWALRCGYKEITLTTFRAVPWNMPFYSRLGFEEIPAGELRPQLRAIVHDEADRGLDPAKRAAMRYRVPLGGRSC
jgi:GNAT superfamily N-acetyltransferase